MKNIDYLVEMTIRWQLLLGVSFIRDYNGARCHAIRVDFLLFAIVIDISQKTDELFRFRNLL